MYVALHSPSTGAAYEECPQQQAAVLSVKVDSLEKGARDVTQQISEQQCQVEGLKRHNVEQARTLSEKHIEIRQKTESEQALRVSLEALKSELEQA